ncbi:MAG: RNA methyltransferase [Candidatus Bathyarchaeia archaeon]
MSATVPSKRKFKLSVALPASLLSEAGSLRDKTIRAGFIGRALAVFRVDEVVIYRDLYGLKNQEREASLISSLLSYMETPQYLRVKVFPIEKSLQYAGILPPLRTPHHPTVAKAEEVLDGEFREGIVVSHDGSSSLVDVGLDKLVRIPVRVKTGLRVTVKVFKKADGLIGELASRKNIPIYWGYRVLNINRPIGGVLEIYKDAFKIATSKYGVPIVEVYEELKTRLTGNANTLVLFGSPREGLAEIMLREGLNLKDYVDLTVNFIPHQGSVTVRTEEALYAVLAILNLLAP